MPKKWFRRKDKFLAVRFYKTRYEEIRQLTRGRVYHDAGKAQYILFAHGHEFILKDGDYIVKNRDDFEVWSEDVFESIFEIIPGQDDEGGAK